MRGKKHSDEVRAAVMAALLAGQGVEEVAKQYDLPSKTVSHWKQRLGHDPEVLQTKKDTDFGELLAVYLRETLTTLAVQVRHFRNTEWLSRQNASDIAVLHGVTTDKAIRLLEALERAAGQEGE